jgi:hypothetical protein
MGFFGFLGRQKNTPRTGRFSGGAIRFRKRGRVGRKGAKAPHLPPRFAGGKERKNCIFSLTGTMVYDKFCG